MGLGMSKHLLLNMCFILHIYSTGMGLDAMGVNVHKLQCILIQYPKHVTQLNKQRQCEL